MEALTTAVNGKNTPSMPSAAVVPPTLVYTENETADQSEEVRRPETFFEASENRTTFKEWSKEQVLLVDGIASLPAKSGNNHNEAPENFSRNQPISLLDADLTQPLLSAAPQTINLEVAEVVRSHVSPSSLNVEQTRSPLSAVAQTIDVAEAEPVACQVPSLLLNVDQTQHLLSDATQTTNLDMPLKTPTLDSAAPARLGLRGAKKDLFSVVLAAVEKELQREENPSAWRKFRRFITCEEDPEGYWLSDENVVRGNWSGKYDSTLSNLAYVIGISNITHFPFICYKNGGVAFTVPYVMMLILLGVPLFYMEACLGQFCSRGVLSIFNLCPLMSGIGYAMMAASIITAIYYSVIISWGLYYFYASFYPNLPWTTCNNAWNTYRCNLLSTDCNLTTQYTRTQEGLCVTKDTGVIMGVWNKTAALTAGVESELAARQYLEYYVLRRVKLADILTSPENSSAVYPDIALCSFLIWLVCALCQSKGIKSSGKVVYATISIFSFLLITLLVHGLTLDGNRDGVAAFLNPDWSTLATTAAWRDSASMVFFSLSISYGGLSSLCSYNRFKNPLLWNIVTVMAGAMIVNLCSSMIIYCLYGFLADSINLQLNEIINNGMDVAFVLVPTAFAYLPYGGFWAALFFGMFIITGIDSQFLLVETITTSLADKFSLVRKKKRRFNIMICAILYLLGLPLCTGVGYDMVSLLSSGTTSWGILMIAFCEVITILWIYGYERFAKDIALMTGQKLSLYWTICWHFTAPALLAAMILLMWVEEHNWDMYPQWAWAILILLPLAIFMWIPLLSVYRLSKAWQPDLTMAQVLAGELKAKQRWGPALSKHRTLLNYSPVLEGCSETAPCETKHKTDTQVADELSVFKHDYTGETKLSDIDTIDLGLGTNSNIKSWMGSDGFDHEIQHMHRTAEAALPSSKPTSAGNTISYSDAVVAPTITPHLPMKTAIIATVEKKSSNQLHEYARELKNTVQEQQQSNTEVGTYEMQSAAAGQHQISPSCTNNTMFTMENQTNDPKAAVTSINTFHVQAASAKLPSSSETMLRSTVPSEREVAMETSTVAGSLALNTEALTPEARALAVLGHNIVIIIQRPTPPEGAVDDSESLSEYEMPESLDISATAMQQIPTLDSGNDPRPETSLPLFTAPASMRSLDNAVDIAVLSELDIHLPASSNNLLDEAPISLGTAQPAAKFTGSTGQ